MKSIKGLCMNLHLCQNKACQSFWPNIWEKGKIFFYSQAMKHLFNDIRVKQLTVHKLDVDSEVGHMCSLWYALQCLLVTKCNPDCIIVVWTSCDFLSSILYQWQTFSKNFYQFFVNCPRFNTNCNKSSLNEAIPNPYSI